MDLFALRQFEKDENKVAKINFDATEFEKRVQQVRQRIFVMLG